MGGVTTFEILLLAFALAVAVPAAVAGLLFGYVKILDRAVEKKNFHVRMAFASGIIFFGIAVAESIFGEGPSMRVGINAALGLTWLGFAVWTKWFDKNA